MTDRILALTPVPSMLLDSSFHILQVSASLAGLVGASSNKYIGLGVYELADTESPQPHSACLRNTIQDAVDTKNIAVGENISATNGSCWHLGVIPIFDKDVLLFLILEFEDTWAQTPGRQPLNDERDTNETYRILVDTVKDYAIFMLDVKGNVTTWNSSAALLKGHSREEIIGHHFSEFYSEENQIANKPGKELEICLREGKVLDEGWRYRKDGSRFWASVTTNPLYPSYP